jgi:hypothetical protein
MNDITSTMERFAIQGTAYGFSAVRVEDLGATEYTLVAIAADASGSVAPFADPIEACMAEIARSCASSPRADNLLLRVSAFDDTVHEVHGYRPLSAGTPGDYRGCTRHGGTTALFDAALNAVASIRDYAQELSDADYECNGLLFVITDGADNASRADASALAAALASATASPHLDSLVTVLVGVGVQDPALKAWLETLRHAAGFHAYVELEHADAATLAKLARFVSRSVARQSQALGTGAAGQPIGF